MNGSLLQRVLDEELGIYGFERNKRGASIYKRTVDGKLQTIGLRKSRSSSKEYVIYFEALAENTFYELSPVCPLKNSYWWSEELCQGQENKLRSLIRNIVVYYFNIQENNLTVHLDGLKHLLKNSRIPFQDSGDRLWRMRGDLIDIVDFELLVDCVFAYIYVTSWHKNLLDMEEIVHPENVSRVASQTVALNQIDETPNKTIYSSQSFEKSGINASESIKRTILNFFDSIHTVEDVKQYIRPEYKSLYEKAL